MQLTVNFVDTTDITKPRLLAICNLYIQTDEPEKVLRDAYTEAIKQTYTKDFSGSAADLLAKVTELVMEQHPSAVLLSVNDDRKLADRHNTIQVNMQKKGIYRVEHKTS